MTARAHIPIKDKLQAMCLRFTCPICGEKLGDLKGLKNEAKPMTDTRNENNQRTARVTVSLSSDSGYDSVETARVSPDQWIRICSILAEPEVKAND